MGERQVNVTEKVTWGWTTSLGGKVADPGIDISANDGDVSFWHLGDLLF
jgi:hypothetical protein